MTLDVERNLALARVLVVDDDAQLLWALDKRLAQIGCECTICNNASEAMQQFAGSWFDLVITDMTMPGIDGLGLIGMIRSQSDVPILVVTGHSAVYAPFVERYGNLKIVRKPLDPRVFIAHVQSLLPDKPNDGSRNKHR